MSQANEHVSKTISMVQGQIQAMERELAQKKKMVNDLSELIGGSRVYADADPSPTVTLGVRSDEFYGKPLASVVRTILEKRAAAELYAASLDEIFSMMKQGGFRFDAKNDGTARRSLAISLAKNSVTFHRLPNGNIGLLEWYPEAKAKPGNGKEDRKQILQDEEGNMEGPYRNDFAEDVGEGPKLDEEEMAEPTKIATATSSKTKK